MDETAKLHSRLKMFLSADVERTLLITGDWGVGKTHAAQLFIEASSAEISNAGLVASSKVSMFGCGSIRELWGLLYTNARLASTSEKFLTRLKNSPVGLLPLVIAEASKSKAGWLSKFVHKFRPISSSVQIPVLESGLGDIGGALASELVRDFFVVFDDIERHADNFPLKDILGFIDQLSTDRGCRVVCICNESVLSGDDRATLNRYREKVFSAEYRFVGSPEKALAVGFSRKRSSFPGVARTAEELAISNIRVVRRLAALADAVEPHIGGIDDRLRQVIEKHLAFIVWACFSRAKSEDRNALLPQLRNSSPFRSVRTNDDDGVGERDPDGLVEWQAAVDLVGFSYEAFDDSVLDFLTSGFLDPAPLIDWQRQGAATLAGLDSQAKFDVLWKQYGQGMVGNDAELAAGFLKLLESEGGNVKLRTFDSAVSLLEDLDVDVTQVVENYVSTQPVGSLADFLDDDPFGGPSSSALRAKGAEVLASSPPSFVSIDEALGRMVADRSWGELEERSLAAAGRTEIEDWLRAPRKDFVAKVRFARSTLRGLPNLDGFSERLDEALRATASDSKLNAIRAKRIFGIE